jgi:hypothetical protein
MSEFKDWDASIIEPGGKFDGEYSDKQKEKNDRDDGTTYTDKAKAIFNQDLNESQV